MSHELLWMWSCCSYQQLLFCNLKIDCLSSERKTFSWYRLLTIQIRLNKYKFLRSCYCCCVSFVTTKKTNHRNHPKPLETTWNHPQPPETIRNHPSKNIRSHQAHPQQAQNYMNHSEAIHIHVKTSRYYQNYP